MLEVVEARLGGSELQGMMRSNQEDRVIVYSSLDSLSSDSKALFKDQKKSER